MTKSKKPLSRRDFLRIMGLGAGATALSACGVKPEIVETATATSVPATPTQTAIPTETPPPGPEVTLRVAHISDMHIEASGPTRERLSRAIRNISLTKPAVDIIINAGDCVMDVLYETKEKALAEWDAFLSGMSGVDVPLYHAIGNHDVWGWGRPPEEQETLKTDPLFGKGMALEKLGIANRYYSFDQGGWHFIVLDSIHLADQVFEHSYTGKLDEDQFAWLANELETTDAATHICIVSHIPIFGACGLLSSSEASGNWVMPGAWQHIDGRQIMELLWKYPNVRLCVSGHTHQVEDLRHHGIKYISDGAISGNWWKGPMYDFPPGYMVVTLYTDGSSESEFVAY